ncbi:hypothetical protein [Mariniphaga sp.]|uniref:hypothetical protein n=1 Tax=Mariniphaga sp. TaxID=1954475 RepID=UPI00356A7BDB
MSLKINSEHKKYIRLVAGLILLILGSFFMFIPFIPLGYIFLIASLFLLATYFPPLNWIIEKIRTKDEKDRIGKVEKKIIEGEKFVDEKLVSDEDAGGNK